MFNGSMNLLRAGAIKSCSLQQRTGAPYAPRIPEMRHCSQALRELSRITPPSKLDEWGIGYSLDYIAPGEATPARHAESKQKEVP